MKPTESTTSSASVSISDCIQRIAGGLPRGTRPQYLPPNPSELNGSYRRSFSVTRRQSSCPNPLTTGQAWWPLTLIWRWAGHILTGDTQPPSISFARQSGQMRVSSVVGSVRLLTGALSPRDGHHRSVDSRSDGEWRRLCRPKPVQRIEPRQSAEPCPSSDCPSGTRPALGD
jgi:hypothetical protein